MNRLIVGSEVIVIRGNDKGKRGKIARLLKDKGRVVVQGVNTVKRHLKATPQRSGGILQVEAALPVSHVMPIDPESGKPTRVRAKVEGDKKQRIAKSGATLTVVKES
jgi:large subunit ribosomal protein L24